MPRFVIVKRSFATYATARAAENAVTGIIERNQSKTEPDRHMIYLICKVVAQAAPAPTNIEVVITPEEPEVPEVP